MLEAAILSQLKTVFEKLENNIYLSYYKSSHSKQNELLDMLQGVSSTSNKIILEESHEVSSYPKFRIFNSQKKSSITFSN